MDEEGLVAFLTNFDFLDLSSGIGGLQLLPANSKQQLRLEVAAGIVSRVEPSADVPSLSATRWRQWVSEPPVSTDQLISYEDPMEEPFVQSIHFMGGSYRVLPGCAERSAEVLQLVLEALLKGRSSLDEALRSELDVLVLSTLRVSEQICDAAGLSRFRAPIIRDGPIWIPASEVFSLLKNSVAFPIQKLDACVGALGMRALASISRRPGGSLRFGESPMIDTDLSIFPIMEFADSFIVVAPTLLASALRHAILCRMLNAGLAKEFVEWYRRAAAGRVVADLLSSDFIEIVDSPSKAPYGSTELFLKFDDSKIAHLIVTTSALDGYSMDDPFASTPTDDEQRLINSRLVEVRSQLRTAHASLDILHLVVVASFGNGSVLGIRGTAESKGTYVLMASVADMGIALAALEGDLLALWRFARAGSELRDSTKVMSFNLIDELWMYLSREHSFYLSDERVPDFLQIPNGLGLALRMKQATAFDRHGVIGPDGSSSFEVGRLFPATDVPIYEQIGSRRSRDILVDGLAHPVWIVPDDASEEAVQFTRQEFMRTVAYWIWQASPFLDDFLNELNSNGCQALQIQVGLSGSPDEWDQMNSGTASDWLTIVRTDQSAISLVLTPGVISALDAADNAAERLLLAALVDEISNRDQSFVSDVVDAVAPLGPKKRLVVVSTSNRPELADGPLPNARAIDPNEVSRRLDDAGQFLSKTFSIGVIERDQRVQKVNHVVSFHFEQMANLVGNLSPDGALEFLIEQNEALIANEARRLVEIPARLACFGGAESSLPEVDGIAPNLSLAAIANRFLIEYVVAQPPSGTAFMDLETYDVLLSHASEIVNKGYLSDQIKFSLADPELSILASGRLGISRDDPLQEATRDFRSLLEQDQVVEAQSRFSHVWRERSATLLAPPQDVEKAFTAEFGVTLTEFGQVLQCLMNLTDPSHGEPQTYPLEEVIKAIATELSWSIERARSAVDLISIQPRVDFFPSACLFEAYPWRFGRDLSYLRRPLAIRNAPAGIQLLWGTRNLSRSGAYLLGLCTSGRFKAKSIEMKRFVGTFRRSDDEAFNDEVADLLEIVPGAIVKRRVKKLGKQRIAESGADLGDIDVLVVVPSKRTIVLVEAKNFEVARTPQELANEVQKIFEGEKSTQKLHAKRVRWVGENVAALLDWLGVAVTHPRAKWTVFGVIVTSEHLLAPLVRSGDSRVVAFTDLQRHPSVIVRS